MHPHGDLRAARADNRHWDWRGTNHHARGNPGRDYLRPSLPTPAEQPSDPGRLQGEVVKPADGRGGVRRPDRLGKTTSGLAVLCEGNTNCPLSRIMKLGDPRPPPTSGTSNGAPNIQTPSRAEYGPECVFIFRFSATAE